MTPVIASDSPAMLEQKASNALASTRRVNGHPGKVCPTSLPVIEVEN
jgi:hypothetical protein